MNPYFTTCKCNLGHYFSTHFVDSLFDTAARYDKIKSYSEAPAIQVNRVRRSLHMFFVKNYI